jgi:hypothetical protein
MTGVEMPDLLTEEELQEFSNPQLVYRFGSAKRQTAFARSQRPFPPSQAYDKKIERCDEIADQFERELLRRLEAKNMGGSDAGS